MKYCNSYINLFQQIKWTFTVKNGHFHMSGGSSEPPEPPWVWACIKCKNSIICNYYISCGTTEGHAQQTYQAL